MTLSRSTVPQPPNPQYYSGNNSDKLNQDTYQWGINVANKIEEASRQAVVDGSAQDDLIAAATTSITTLNGLIAADTSSNTTVLAPASKAIKFLAGSTTVGQFDTMGALVLSGGATGTTLNFSSTATVGSLTTSGTVAAGAITGSSLNLSGGTISAGTLNVGTVNGSSLAVGSGSISGGTITGSSLSVSGGSVTCGSLVANGTTISSSPLSISTGSSTTGISLSTSGANGALNITDSSGSHIKLTGSGGSSKYLRCQGNTFQVMNSANSSAVLTVDDAGSHFMPNAIGLYWSNGTNTANLKVLTLDTVNNVLIGNSASNVIVQAPLLPISDNSYSCGGGSNRWTAVYAVNGTIQTSDPALKRDIQPLPEATPIIRDINPVTYKWKDGPDETTHWGFLATEVAEAVAKTGRDFGGHILADGRHHLNVSELVPILWQTIRELDARVKDLEDKR